MEHYPYNIVIKEHGKIRTITSEKLLINKNTPVGEDADLYEIKPYEGRKYIPWSIIIKQEPEL